MKIALVMSLYNESTLIEHTLDSILSNSKYECDVYINLSGTRFFEKNIECISDINEKNNKNYKINLFVLGNEVLNLPLIGNSVLTHQVYNDLGYDIMVGGSPDYVLTDKNAFNEFIDKSLPYLENKYTISCVEHENSNVRSAFHIITKKCTEEVGYYDPNFVPTGLSDNDFHRRCLLVSNPGQDLEFYVAPENDINASYGVSIVVPSCHMAYAAHGSLGIDYTNFYLKNSLDRFNALYYYRKWGGLPGCAPGKLGTDTYIHPFNNPEIPLKITIDHIGQGYSEHDRSDIRLASII